MGSRFQDPGVLVPNALLKPPEIAAGPSSPPVVAGSTARQFLVDHPPPDYNGPWLYGRPADFTPTAEDYMHWLGLPNSNGSPFYNPLNPDHGGGPTSGSLTPDQINALFQLGRTFSGDPSVAIPAPSDVWPNMLTGTPNNWPRDLKPEVWAAIQEQKMKTPAYRAWADQLAAAREASRGGDSPWIDVGAIAKTLGVGAATDLAGPVAGAGSNYLFNGLETGDWQREALTSLSTTELTDVFGLDAADIEWLKGNTSTFGKDSPMGLLEDLGTIGSAAVGLGESIGGDLFPSTPTMQVTNPDLPGADLGGGYSTTDSFRDDSPYLPAISAGNLPALPARARVPLVRLGGYALKNMPATRTKPAGQRWVKIRRMNPLNHRALARSFHRIGSAERICRHLFHFTHHPATKRAFGRKRRRR